MARLAKNQRSSNVGGLAETAEPRMVQSLQRGLAILEAFTPEATSLSNADIARRTGIGRSTVSRLTETLTGLGCLTFLPRTGRYQLGAAMVTFCHALLASMPQRVAARPLLQELAEFARMPASMGMREKLELVTIETAWHAGLRPARFDLGTRLPLATTAMGRSVLYAMPAAERDGLMDRLAGTFAPEAWTIHRQRIDAAFDSIARRGFCASIGDRLDDLYAVGAPVVAPSGAVFAISCGGLPGETTVDRLLNEVGPALADIARRLAAVPDLIAEA